jgi:glycosyltransferase involved in cell wall biosynthesis
MRVLLVEPFFAGSHRAWAEGYAANSGHEVRLLTHPGRWWKWRMRGSALTLATALDTLEDWLPDLVIVSDMIDLAQFRTFSRSTLGDIPTILYFHESQLTYPTSPQAQPDISFALTNWLSAVAADAILFNSGYHLDLFYESLPALLKSFPDLTHRHLIGEVSSKSEVLPVGVDLGWISPRSPRSGPPRVLWNHRWEHDKDPDAFADAVAALVDAGSDFELVLLGPRPPRGAPALTRLREIAGERIIRDEEAPLDSYRELVSACDIVVSTSRQEFFGISVVEAIAAGCRPVLPDRLSYPWLIPGEYHEAVLYQENGLIDALAAALDDPLPPRGLPEAMGRFSWEQLGPVYDKRFAELAVTASGSSAGR